MSQKLILYHNSEVNIRLTQNLEDKWATVSKHTHVDIFASSCVKFIATSTKVRECNVTN